MVYQPKSGLVENALLTSGRSGPLGVRPAHIDRAVWLQLALKPLPVLCVQRYILCVHQHCQTWHGRTRSFEESLGRVLACQRPFLHRYKPSPHRRCKPYDSRSGTSNHSAHYVTVTGPSVPREVFSTTLQRAHHPSHLFPRVITPSPPRNFCALPALFFADRQPIVHTHSVGAGPLGVGAGVHVGATSNIPAC